MAKLCFWMLERRREEMSRITRQRKSIASNWTKSVCEGERLLFLAGGWTRCTFSSAVGKLTASGVVNSDCDSSTISRRVPPSVQINLGTSRVGPPARWRPSVERSPSLLRPPGRRSSLLKKCRSGNFESWSSVDHGWRSQLTDGSRIITIRRFTPFMTELSV